MKLLALFGAEFASFLLATLNFRYCAKGHRARTVSTDLLIAAVGFVIIKLVSEANTLGEMASYVAGGGCGSYLGMWITKDLEEK